ncbi:MAG: hypothetical protein BGO78_07615 [Chloroflexi bacterium 44-23]|nr:MAG: hypothetical protein BGO78_07615 [Chloroflexi bacterium 44-23]
MKKSYQFLLVILVFALILAACSPASPSSPQPTADLSVAENNPLVFEGNLMPINTMVVNFFTSGVVAEVLVKEGQAVSRNQVLARLVIAPELETNLRRAQQELLLAQQAVDKLDDNAAVELAQTQLSVIQLSDALNTAQENYKNDSTSENEAIQALAQAKLEQAEERLLLLSSKGFDPALEAAAQASVTSAQATLASAEAAFKATDLHAPFDGTITNLNLQIGQQITPAFPVLILADFSNWVIKTDNLTEVNVVNINVDQAVKVVLDALPDLTLTGTVTQINLQSEEKRGDVTYTVTISINENDPRMRWGMTGAVQFAR